MINSGRTTIIIALCLWTTACDIESLDASDPGESPDLEDKGNAQIEQNVAAQDPICETDNPNCGGTIISRDAAFASGTVVGELVVYYNPSTGCNCARLNHVGPAYGVSCLTEVKLTKCSTTERGSGCGAALTINPDNGYFAYYAGPVRVRAPNNCVIAEGKIYWNGDFRKAHTKGVVGC